MPGDLVASHRYHFADLLSSSSTSAWPLVCCWSVAYLPLSPMPCFPRHCLTVYKKRCVSGGEKEVQRNSVMHSDVSQVAWRDVLCMKCCTCQECLRVPPLWEQATAPAPFLTRFSFSSAKKFHRQHLKMQFIAWLQLTFFKTERRGVHAENQSTRKPITFLEWSTSLRFLLVAWAGVQGRLQIRYV